MSANRIEEIRERLAATHVFDPGGDFTAPWEVFFEHDEGAMDYVLEVLDRHNDVVVDLHDAASLELANLIANAPDDLAFLLSRVDGLTAALERTLHNFEAVLARRPVRDATETIAEARRVLRNLPTRSTVEHLDTTTQGEFP